MADLYPEYSELVAAHAASDPAVVAGKLFGKECAKCDGAAFILYFRGDIVFRLGEARAAALAAGAGGQLFDPSGKGRPMKAWVQLDSRHRRIFKPLSDEAKGFVQAL